MGRRVEKTLDMGMDREYQMDLSPRCGLVIGKTHGIGARSNQEDAFGISDTDDEVVDERGILLILSDGMGGMSDGEKASTATVVACLDYFETHEMSDEPWEELQDMVYVANEQVQRVLERSAGVGGATLAAIWIRDLRAYWISVGDSRLYLYREGVLYQMNQEHNYGARLDSMAENGEISRRQAAEDPRRKALTSYIGMDEVEEADWNEEELVLQKGDYLLLMSDGVFGTLSEQEIVDALQYPAYKAARHLEMQIETRRKRKQDNYTAMIAEVI